MAFLVAVTVGTAGLLWWAVINGLAGSELVKAKVDAVKAGIGAGLAVGTVFGLYLAWRRQQATEADLDNRERTLAHQQQVALETKQHQELIAADSRADALSRRITEQYTKASDQLGSDSAPVRLAGLLGLERLAQAYPDEPHLRQTVVDVVCAYLRMPFTYRQPHEPERRVATLGIRRPKATTSFESSTQRGDRTYPKTPTAASPSHNAEQEREVRLTAQRILSRHLTTSSREDEAPDTYWTNIAIDLSNATLIDFNLYNWQVTKATFNGANFHGDTDARYARFQKEVKFRGAQFHGRTLFRQAHFFSNADWTETVFFNYSDFSDAKFFYYTYFNHAKFCEQASFSTTRFYGDFTEFINVRFRGVTNWSRAQFTGIAAFARSRFHKATMFKEARFDQTVSFNQARFDGPASFHQADFIGYASFDEAMFCDKARFDTAQFGDNLTWIGATFLGDNWFEQEGIPPYGPVGIQFTKAGDHC